MPSTYHFSQTDGVWALDPDGEPFTVQHEAGGNVYLDNGAGIGFAVPRAFLGLTDEAPAAGPVAPVATEEE